MKYYSNEIVFRGHPDKVCDQISDAILDEILKQDKLARCAIETVGGKGLMLITGEVTTNAKFNVEEIAKRVLHDVGYNTNIKIINNLGSQSPEIGLGTNEETMGAGDNGMMFGMACRETKEYLPIAMVILQEFSRRYDKLRQKDTRFLPDGKAQITGRYEGRTLKKIETLTICYQNTEEEREKTDQILKEIALDIVGKYNIEIKEFLINPTGRFNIGGFDSDTGLTGRKIVVDSYQSFANVGGGAFSGKDPTKVDRSGAYIARELSKDFLKENEEYEWVEIQVSYAIGKEYPLAIYIRTNKGDFNLEGEENREYRENIYSRCRVRNIIDELNLREISYEERAMFGHFTN